MDTEAQKRVKEAEEKLKAIRTFLDDLDKYKLPVPKPLLDAYGLFLKAAEEGIYVAKEAAEIQRTLAETSVQLEEYMNAEDTRHGVGESRPQEVDHTRKWLNRSTFNTLQIDNSGSLVNRVTTHWKEELISHFTDQAKKQLVNELWKRVQPQFAELLKRGGVPEVLGEEAEEEGKNAVRKAVDAVSDWLRGIGKSPTPEQKQLIEQHLEQCEDYKRKLIRDMPMLFQQKFPECLPR